MARQKRSVWEPSSDDYQRVLVEQNPWHRSGHVPDEWAREVERPLARYLPGRLLDDNPRRFQLILGPRRVGKTTALYQAVRSLLERGLPPRSLWWLRLDHPILMQGRLDILCRTAMNLAGASADRPAYFFFDELNYARDWDLWLKTFYDETWPVRIAATSSSTAALRDRRLESGIGRWEEQYLAPYLFSEFLSLIGMSVEIPVGATLADTLDACIRERVEAGAGVGFLEAFLLAGGFPELLITEAERVRPQRGPDLSSLFLHSQRILRSDAVERAIYKDIPQAFGVDDPMLLERLLYTLAGQFTGILSPASICSALGNLSQPTFNRYLSYLELAFLVFTLPNYSGNEVAVQKRGRKLYFVDAAVRNAALQRGLAPLNEPAEMGHLFENLVASHLRALGEQSQTRLYHWRDKTDEIDFVYDHPDRPLAFEVARSGDHPRRGLVAFADRFPRFRGRCYLVANQPHAAMAQDRPDGVGLVPLDLFLLAVGAQAARELELRLHRRDPALGSSGP